MKHEFSKIEIATYLRDFYRNLSLAALNVNVSFCNSFQYLLKYEKKNNI